MLDTVCFLFNQLEEKETGFWEREGTDGFSGLIGIGFGKEKQESLAGAYLFLFTLCLLGGGFFYLERGANPGPAFGQSTGLNDKEIEERVGGLVMTGI